MRRWLVLSLLLTAAALAASLLTWNGAFGELPAVVPVHWDIMGNPDDWVDRGGLLPYLLLPPGVMALIVLLGLALPWLSPKKFEVESFRTTYEFVMLVLVVLFGYIHVTLLLVYLQSGVDGVRLMVGGMMLFFAVLGNVMGKVRKNFWMGVRTPWTLASDAVWIGTHRLAAWLWTTGGLVLGVAVLAGLPLAWAGPPFFAMVLYPVLHSLILYKRLEKAGKLHDAESPSPNAI
jgi:uncharacterized membrane protein